MEGTNLVGDVVAGFLCADAHVATAETHEVGEAGLRPNANAVLLRHLDGGPHPHGVSGVEAASDIGGGDVPDNLFVVAQLVHAEAFAHVAVEVNLVRHIHPPGGVMYGI